MPLRLVANRAQLMADLDWCFDWPPPARKDRAAARQPLRFCSPVLAAGSCPDSGILQQRHLPAGGDLGQAPKAAPVADYPPNEEAEKLEGRKTVGFLPLRTISGLKRALGPMRLLHPDRAWRGVGEQGRQERRVSVVAMVLKLRPLNHAQRAIGWAVAPGSKISAAAPKAGGGSEKTVCPPVLTT